MANLLSLTGQLGHSVMTILGFNRGSQLQNFMNLHRRRFGMRRKSNGYVKFSRVSAECNWRTFWLVRVPLLKASFAINIRNDRNLGQLHYLQTTLH